MKLLAVTADKQAVALGDLLTLTFKLHNDLGQAATSQTPYGNDPLHLFAYNEDDGWQGKFPPVAGAWRVLAGTLPRMNLNALEWPYRWGFSGSLAPNGDLTVQGQIKITVPSGFRLVVQLAQEVNQMTGQIFEFPISLSAPNVVSEPLAGKIATWLANTPQK